MAKDGAIPAPADVNSGASVSVRKIDNGYIVTESCYGPGGYESSERFSKTAPDVIINTGKREPAPANPLRDAIKALR